MQIILVFFSISDPGWPTGLHFVTQTCPQPFLGHAWFDFVQAWHTGTIWWHTHAPHFILWSDQRWLTGKLTTILVVKKKNPVLNKSLTISITDLVPLFLPYLHHEASFMKIKKKQIWLLFSFSPQSPLSTVYKNWSASIFNWMIIFFYSPQL